MIFLDLLVSNDKISALPNKKRSEILSKAQAEANMMEKSWFRNLFWGGLFLLLIVSLGIGYFAGWQSGVSASLVGQFIYFIVLSAKTKPYVIEKLPEEYR